MIASHRCTRHTLKCPAYNSCWVGRMGMAISALWVGAGQAAPTASAPSPGPAPAACKSNVYMYVHHRLYYGVSFQLEADSWMPSDNLYSCQAESGIAHLPNTMCSSSGSGSSTACFGCWPRNVAAAFPACIAPSVCVRCCYMTPVHRPVTNRPTQAWYITARYRQ